MTASNPHLEDCCEPGPILTCNAINGIPIHVNISGLSGCVSSGIPFTVTLVDGMAEFYPSFVCDASTSGGGWVRCVDIGGISYLEIGFSFEVTDPGGVYYLSCFGPRVPLGRHPLNIQIPLPNIQYAVASGSPCTGCASVSNVVCYVTT